MLLVQDAQRETERGFNAGDAVGGAFELDFLFVQRVRRMIGGDAVDGAFEQGGDDGLAIGFRAQWRVHLGVGVEVADGCVGEREVMWRGLAGDVQAIGLGLADGSEGFSGRDMLHVQVRAEAVVLEEFAHEMNVALDDRRLGVVGIAAQAEAEGDRAGVHDGAVREARVFGVLADGQVEVRGAAQRSLHHVGLEDGLAVVGEAERAGPGEGFKVGEGLAEPSPAWQRPSRRGGLQAAVRGASIQRRVSTVSLTGSVLGMATTAVKPPAAAAFVPVAMVSL